MKMMLRIHNYISVLAAVAALFLLSGCIKNDLPYPRIPQEILAIAAEGESSPAEIDARNRKVTLYLDESADINAVKFTEFKVTEGAEVSENLLEGTYNLSSPLKIILSLYQDYEWTIDAEQEISLYFTVAGQVGETEIDRTAHTAVVSVAGGTPLDALVIESVKLGAEGVSTLSPSLAPGQTIDLSSPLEVEVTTFGETVKWTLSAVYSAKIVSTTEVDAWSKVIWAYGATEAGRKCGFEYRRADAGEWIDVPEKDIVVNGGSFSVCIPHLEPLTTYIVRAVSEESYGDEVTVTTQATEILPDGSFDQWWLKNNKTWFPWAENGTPFWDTGNTGASTLGQSNVTPSDHVPPGATGQSAKLETRFVGIGILGKLAAGSIFTGSFKKVDGTNGILDFGRPWDMRPTKLRGYMDYTTAPINYTSSEFSALKDRPDTCNIYIALTDWEMPYEIRTNPKNRQLFDPESPAVIGYGSLQLGRNTNGYVPFEIIIKYKSTSRKPRYILVCCAASKYGDFFTGGSGAVLYVDQFSLDYDY